MSVIESQNVCEERALCERHLHTCPAKCAGCPEGRRDDVSGGARDDIARRWFEAVTGKIDVREET